MVKVTLHDQTSETSGTGTTRHVEIDAAHAITICLDPDSEAQSIITTMGDLTLNGLLCQLAALLELLGTQGYHDHSVADTLYPKLFNLLPVFFQNASDPQVQKNMLVALKNITNAMNDAYYPKTIDLLKTLLKTEKGV